VFSDGGLDNTPSSDDVIPPFALVYLLGRVPGPQRFRSGRVSFNGVLLESFGRMIFKGRLRLFQLNTAYVIRRVVTSIITALRALPRGRIPT
jgi:nucleoside recognition membrane protein YjiH